MITRLVKMTFRPDATEEFLDLFDCVRHDIGSFPGCIHLDLLQDQKENNVLFTYSLWKCEDDLEVYRKSPLFQRTWSKTKLLFEGKPEAWTTKLIISNSNDH